MAIERVKKVLIAGLSEDFEAISSSLQRLSLLHIIDFGEKEEYTTGSGGKSLEKAEKNLSRVTSAAEFASRFNPKKRGMLEARPELSEGELEALDDEQIFQFCAKVEECEDALAKIRSRETQILNSIQQLMPYLSLDVAFEDIKNTKTTMQSIGTVQEGAAQDLEAALLEAGAVYKEIGAVSDARIYYICALNENADNVIASMRNAGFSEANLPAPGLPKEEDIRLRQEFDEISSQRQEWEQKAKEVCEDIDLIRYAQDKYTVLRDREALNEYTAVTQKAFILNGWVCERHIPRLESELKKLVPEVCIEYSDAEEGEIEPTALRNSKLFTPYEAVTDMYSPPNQNEIDPTMIMAPFFFCFFGMMVSDAGYGILLTIGAILFLRKTRARGMMGKIAGIIGIGGISTLIWGALYGGWFSIPGIKPIWFAPLDDPLQMIIVCVIIGIIQISFGMVTNAVQLIKKGEVGDAICDHLFILLIIWFGPLMLLNVPFAKYFAGLGLLGMLVTGGRKSKGIGKIVGGLTKIYGITGYLADILSYTRLFGLGMATGVIGMVFNTIAGMLMGNPIGFVFGIAVLIIGHGFNIGINVLGAYVHACRLQYIEFYSKFYEGGGRAFVPFTYNTKYIYVKR